MTTFDNVTAVLDARATPVRLFVRDDDAGWDTPGLIALLDTLRTARVPVDLAVIPWATDVALAHALCARRDAAPELLGLHQHGCVHANHEAVGRKCEFGPARSATAQRADLVAGRDWLRALFGARLDPIFTPPWNRCTPGTAALLAELGFAALSRDAGAEPQSALCEIPVHVDWCKERRRDDSGAAILQALARALRAHDVVGLMLHHAAMDARDLALLATWLPRLVRHRAVRCVRMADLLEPVEAAALLR